jgi:hypothetical protein
MKPNSKVQIQNLQKLAARRVQAATTSRKEVPSSGSNLQQFSKEIGG